MVGEGTSPTVPVPSQVLMSMYVPAAHVGAEQVLHRYPLVSPGGCRDIGARECAGGTGSQRPQGGNRYVQPTLTGARLTSAGSS